MTEQENTKYYLLNDARHLFHVNPPPCINTLRKWVRTGVNGVKLDTIRIGKRLYVTREGVDKFMQDVVEAQNK